MSLPIIVCLRVVPSLLTHSSSKVSRLEIAGEGLETTSIAVPSRLKNLGSTVTTRKKVPLSGWRIAVKDIFQVEGIKTSVCNRAYHELYPPAPKTAACVEILQQKGAHILGTTKLAAFAATEEPIECVDYQAPWNPRADGYQSPAGSSSGSGVAVASYDWVDVAIGSDSKLSLLLVSRHNETNQMFLVASGSGRRPGHWNGCYAHRPTHGVLPTNGYIPSFELVSISNILLSPFANISLDHSMCQLSSEEASIYARSLPPIGMAICCPQLIHLSVHTQAHFVSILVLIRYQLPPKIIYPTNYLSLITNEHQKQLIDNFVIDLEKSLGVKHVKMSFDEFWDADPPADAKGDSLLEYMKDVRFLFGK